MLIKDSNKISSKALKEAMSSGCMVGLQNKQVKEALFIKRVQQTVKEEQAKHIKWKVHLGKDPMLEQTRRQIVEEREIALHEYMVKRGDVRQEEDFAAGPPKLFSRRVLCDAGQAPAGAPSFQFYSSFQWELKQRALKLFQQAARKVVNRCRMNRRLACLKKLADSMRNPPSADRVEEEKTYDLEIEPDKVSPFSFPIFSDVHDPLACIDLVEEPVDPIEVTVKPRIPLVKVQVPQQYKLMGYRPVSTWDAFNSYIPTTLARPLRTGPPVTTAENEKEAQGAEVAPGLTFSAPEGLLRPPAANPLRIFNPVPGLQAYKTTPKYLDGDLEVHLCPLPRFTVPESSMRGIRTQTSQTQRKFLDRKEVIKGVMTWKDFDSITQNCLSTQPALPNDCALRRSVDYSTDILPLTAPPFLTALPDDLKLLTDKLCEGLGVQLTPEMIRAEFLAGEALVSNSNLTTGMTARHQREHQMETTYWSEFNQMGKRVMTRLKQLGVTDGCLHSPEEDNE
uniref:cilia- and flagella-associated protein 221-like n=1 Tax=Monopterus albus TaxID=43700 RepID=UPI0009B3769D|nr:cilia- and flagella-associated protein 221-like [Monopterus albus]